MTLFDELKRRKVIQAGVAYLVAGWIVIEVTTQVFPVFDLPNWASQAVVLLVLIGFPVAIALSWAFDLTLSGIVRTRDIDAIERDSRSPGRPSSASLSNPESAEKSVAILPFTDLSEARDQDWFCDGLAEEIIDVLCCVRNLRVASRTASFRFRDGSVDPREIGRQLQVGAILEGSVRKSGNQLRITAQLIGAEDGYHMWSESFDRKLEDVFAIQSEIARKVSAALRVSLTGDQAGRCERYAPSNMRAHEFYLRGRQHAGRINQTDWKKAASHFRRAIELDPQYAQAHAGLADILAQTMMWRLTGGEDVLPEAARAAHRALELAPDLAEAHVALGHVRSLTGDFDGAARSFERALAMNPELFEAHFYYARHSQARGEHARAAALFRSAFALRPDDYTVLASAVPALEGAGDTVGAEAVAREVVEGLQYQLELDPDNARAQTLLPTLYARLGQAEKGVPYMEAALRERPSDYATFYNAACFYSYMGDKERALDLLERACDFGGGNRDWIAHDQDLISLHDEPRFQKLIADVCNTGDKEA